MISGSRRVTNVSNQEIVLPAIPHAGFTSVRLAPGCCTTVNAMVWSHARSISHADPGAKRLEMLLHEKKIEVQNETEE